jgi:hypothetical protein
MREFAILGIAIIFLFVMFVIYWNKKWKGKLLDEREVHIRLKVRELISRAVEIGLIAGVGFHFLVQPLTGLQAFIILGVPGILAEAFGNWWLRKVPSDG